MVIYPTDFVVKYAGPGNPFAVLVAFDSGSHMIA